MSRVIKCYNCSGEGHFARECPSGIHSLIQNQSKRETGQPGPTPSAINASASAILPKTARKTKSLETMTVMKKPETSPKKGEDLASSERRGQMVLVATTAKRPGTWHVTASWVVVMLM